MGSVPRPRHGHAGVEPDPPAHRQQSNALFIIDDKSNNTDIFETFRAMADALREHFGKYGAQPLYLVIGRGGPNLVRGRSVMRDTCEVLGIPYRIFGFDSA